MLDPEKLTQSILERSKAIGYEIPEMMARALAVGLITQIEDGPRADDAVALPAWARTASTDAKLIGWAILEVGRSLTDHLVDAFVDLAADVRGLASSVDDVHDVLEGK